MPKILYVEDNDDTVFMMRSRLTRAGFDVIVAVDGEQGVALAAATESMSRGTLSLLGAEDDQSKAPTAAALYGTLITQVQVDAVLGPYADHRSRGRRH